MYEEAEAEKRVRMPERAWRGAPWCPGWSGRADGSVRKDDVPVKCPHGNASRAAGRLGLRRRGWELLLR